MADNDVERKKMQKDYSRFRGLSKDVDKTFYPGYWDKDKVIATLTIAEVMTFGLEMYLEEVELLRLAIMRQKGSLYTMLYRASMKAYQHHMAKREGKLLFRVSTILTAIACESSTLLDSSYCVVGSFGSQPLDLKQCKTCGQVGSSADRRDKEELSVASEMHAQLCVKLEDMYVLLKVLSDKMETVDQRTVILEEKCLDMNLDIKLRDALPESRREMEHLTRSQPVQWSADVNANSNNHTVTSVPSENRGDAVEIVASQDNSSSVGRSHESQEDGTNLAATHADSLGSCEDNVQIVTDFRQPRPESGGEESPQVGLSPASRCNVGSVVGSSAAVTPPSPSISEVLNVATTATSPISQQVAKKRRYDVLAGEDPKVKKSRCAARQNATSTISSGTQQARETSEAVSYPQVRQVLGRPDGAAYEQLQQILGVAGITLQIERPEGSRSPTHSEAGSVSSDHSYSCNVDSITAKKNELREEMRRQTLPEEVLKLRWRNLSEAARLYCMCKKNVCYRPVMEVKDLIDVTLLVLERNGQLDSAYKEMICDDPPDIPKFTMRSRVFKSRHFGRICHFLDDYVGRQGFDVKKLNPDRVLFLRRTITNTIGYNIKTDSVSVSSNKVSIDMKGFKAGQIWHAYEEETLLRMYYIMRVVEGLDDDEDFWSDFVVRLADAGVYREKEDCRKLIGEIGVQVHELLNKEDSELDDCDLLKRVVAVDSDLLKRPYIISSIEGKKNVLKALRPRTVRQELASKRASNGVASAGASATSADKAPVAQASTSSNGQAGGSRSKEAGVTPSNSSNLMTIVNPNGSGPSYVLAGQSLVPFELSQGNRPPAVAPPPTASESTRRVPGNPFKTSNLFAPNNVPQKVVLSEKIDTGNGKIDALTGLVRDVLRPLTQAVLGDIIDKKKK